MAKHALALLLLAALALAAVGHVAADGHHDGEDGPEGPGEEEHDRAVFEALRPAFEACKDQAMELCRPPQDGEDGGHGGDGEHRRLRRRGGGDRQRNRPNPALLTLCLSDNADSLTGTCATAWAAVDEASRDEAVEVAVEALSPKAQFKRACAGDVETYCDTEVGREDVLECLGDADGVSEDCADMVEEVEEHLAEREAEKNHDSETREALHALRPAMEACETQAKALCKGEEGTEDAEDADGADGDARRLDGHHGERERKPRAGALMGALCLSDHEDELTGDCAAEWAAVDADAKEVAVDFALDHLHPKALLHRACAEEAEAKCDTDAGRADVLACLEADDTVTEECHDAVAMFKEHHAEKEAGDDAGDDGGDGGEDDGGDGGDGGDGTVVVISPIITLTDFMKMDADQVAAPPVTLEAFQAIDDMELAHDDDGGNHGHGPPLALIVGGGVALVALVVLVAVVVVRRRRANRAPGAPRGLGLKGAAGVPRFRQMGSFSSSDSGSPRKPANVQLVVVQPSPRTSGEEPGADAPHVQVVPSATVIKV